jgi:GxxExxY protein
MTGKERIEREEYLAKEIVDCAYKVHTQLGPGLLEKVYEACFCHELAKKGIPFQRQISIPIVYDELIFDEGLRLDVLVDDLVVCELKAKDELNPVWKAQIISHLKITNKSLGFLINFNGALIKNGINRFFIACGSMPVPLSWKRTSMLCATDPSRPVGRRPVTI